MNRLCLAPFALLSLCARPRPAAADTWEVPGLDPEVLSLAQQARACALASAQVAKPDLLTVIDYSVHSRERRLWVLDLAQRRVLVNTWVAHGEGSEGRADDGLPEVFSNDDRSLASSLGLARTGGVNEESQHDFALALEGLEPGFNDHLAARDVVMHPAGYVSADMLRRTGRMGRSHGCPALPSADDSDVARQVIDTIAGGSLVFSYYPDRTWLARSPMLHCAAAPAPAERAPARGTWLDQRWLQEADPGKVATLASHLAGLDVSTLYPNLAHGQPTPIPGAGGALGWVPEPAAARALVQALRAALPQARVVPYKGFKDCDWLEAEDWSVRNRARAAAFAASAEAVGADGVQVDLECTNVEDPAILPRLDAFLLDVKTALGPRRTLSVAIPIVEQPRERWQGTPWADEPWVALLAAQPNPRNPLFSAAPAVWEVVFSRADEVAVMLYDTWLTREQADQYPMLVESEIWAAADFARRHDTDLVAGLRFQTWDSVEEPGGRAMCWHAVENPVRGLEGLARALDRPLAGGHRVRQVLSGVAWYRLDLPLAAERYDPVIGERYLAVIGGGP